MEIPIYTKGQKGKPGDHFDSHIHDDFEKVIQELLDCEEITHPTAVGICKAVIDKGTEHLTESQMKVLERALTVIDFECSNCGETLSWEELHMLEGSPTESQMCSSCQYDMDKMRD